MKFTHNQPTKIYFGKGQVNLIPEIIKEFGNSVLLIGPKMNEFIEPMFNMIENLLVSQEINVIKYLEVEPNPSTITVDNALNLANNNNVDVVLAVGGGSAMDVGKIVALCYGKNNIDWKEMFEKYSDFDKIYPKLGNNKKSFIAVPTTAGTGSQCTQASVITDSDTKMKLTIFHQDNFPNYAVIDPNLAMTLPLNITKHTAFDAFTHAFESYIRNDSNIICEMLSISAIEAIIEYLPKVLKDNKLEFREKLSMSDTFGGVALSNCGACLPHPLAEVIGSFITKISHGQSLALVYPTFLKYTSYKYTKKYAKVCRLFDKTYVNKSDEECANDFHIVLTNWLNDIEFNQSLHDYTQDSNVISEIQNFSLWDHLKMEEPKVIRDIVNEICKI